MRRSSQRSSRSRILVVVVVVVRWKIVPHWHAAAGRARRLVTGSLTETTDEKRQRAEPSVSEEIRAAGACSWPD